MLNHFGHLRFPIDTKNMYWIVFCVHCIFCASIFTPNINLKIKDLYNKPCFTQQAVYDWPFHVQLKLKFSVASEKDFSIFFTTPLLYCLFSPVVSLINSLHKFCLQIQTMLKKTLHYQSTGKIWNFVEDKNLRNIPKRL